MSKDEGGNYGQGFLDGLRKGESGRAVRYEPTMAAMRDCLKVWLGGDGNLLKSHVVQRLISQANALLSGDLPDDQEEEGRWIGKGIE